MANEMNVPAAPAIQGLRFRGLNAPQDYANMQRIVATSSIVDKQDYAETVEDISKYYQHLANCDPEKDVLFVELDGIAIGYSRVWFNEKPDGSRLYIFFVNLVPDMRGKGIGTAMLKWAESRMHDMASKNPRTENLVWVWAMDDQKYHRALYEANGYEVVRYHYLMVRPDLENIPDCQLPEGLVERPPESPEEIRMVWDADVEASKDGWGWVEPPEEWFQTYVESRYCQPELWKVAWDGKRVAGAVQNYIDHAENSQYNRKWGWTENIHVDREWRGMGVAKALIASSFRLLKDKGMEQAVLGVDTQNPTGALHLYTAMGFKKDKTSFTYSKRI